MSAWSSVKWKNVYHTKHWVNHSFERANHIQLSSENNEINTKKLKQKGDKMKALRRQEGVNVAKENFV